MEESGRQEVMPFESVCPLPREIVLLDHAFLAEQSRQWELLDGRTIDGSLEERATR
jgi:hypothetical protein